MKRVFISVGTSLLSRALGASDFASTFRHRAVLEAWDGATPSPSARELSAAEGQTRLQAALDAARSLPGGNGSRLPTLEDIGRHVELLRDAFSIDQGDEVDQAMLCAELASLWRLLSTYPMADGDARRLYHLGEGDHVALLATDSPDGFLAGHLLHQVLREHPALGGAAVEVVWPRHWQAHDGLRLAEQGATNLLSAVSRRIASDLRACPLFVLTGGIKLGIAILSQVSCWSQAEGHDGLFLKLEDPGGIFFPPSTFVARARGPVLLPRPPKTERLRSQVQLTGELRKIVEAMEPPMKRATSPRTAPRTALVITAGVGLVRQSRLLEARFGTSSRLADPALWRAIDRLAPCGSWADLRHHLDGAPTDDELASAEVGVQAQLREAWLAGRTRDLPAELAALRALWSAPRPDPEPLLANLRRLVLLATDSLTGEYCASLVARFLEGVRGCGAVELESVAGFHPFGGSPLEGQGLDRLAELVARSAVDCDRLLVVPLGGTKLHLPLLTPLATRLQAPMLLGHSHLERPIVVPWLESEGGHVRGARLAESWPELADLPTVRLELAGG